MTPEAKKYLWKLQQVKKFLESKGYYNWVVCGSGCLFMTGLLNREPHDVDAYIIGDNVYEDFYHDKRKKRSQEFYVNGIQVHIWVTNNFNFMNVMEINGIKFGMNIARTLGIKAAWSREKDVDDINYAIEKLTDIRDNTPPIFQDPYDPVK